MSGIQSTFPPSWSIKRILRGTISIGSGNSSATATIPSVDLSKAVIENLGVRGQGDVPAGTIELTNSTTVTAHRGYDMGFITVHAYQVVEYY